MPLPIPPLPVDFSHLATSGLLVLGQVVGAAGGVIVTKELCRSGIRWFRAAFIGDHEPREVECEMAGGCDGAGNGVADVTVDVIGCAHHDYGTYVEVDEDDGSEQEVIYNRTWVSGDIEAGRFIHGDLAYGTELDLMHAERGEYLDSDDPQDWSDYDFPRY